MLHIYFYDYDCFYIFPTGNSVCVYIFFLNLVYSKHVDDAMHCICTYIYIKFNKRVI